MANGVSKIDWREHGVKIIRADQLDPNTPQTPGMDRAAAITHARTGAKWQRSLLRSVWRFELPDLLAQAGAIPTQSRTKPNERTSPSGGIPLRTPIEEPRIYAG